MKSSSNKKQRSRNKNRQSDSALLEQARSASPSLAEKALKPKEIKEEEKDEIKVTEEIELPISNPGDIDNCKVEENYSPTKIVRPKFERCDSLTKFIDPDPLKVIASLTLKENENKVPQKHARVKGFSKLSKLICSITLHQCGQMWFS